MLNTSQEWPYDLSKTGCRWKWTLSFSCRRCCAALVACVFRWSFVWLNFWSALYCDVGIGGMLWQLMRLSNIIGAMAFDRLDEHILVASRAFLSGTSDCRITWDGRKAYLEDAIFGLGLENSWLQLRQVNVDDIGDVEGLRLFSPFKCSWFPKISSIWKGSFVFFSLTSYIEISSHLLMGRWRGVGIQLSTWGWNHDRKDQEVGAAGAHGSLWSPLCW